MSNSLNATTHEARFAVPSDGIYAVTVLAYRKNQPASHSITGSWKVCKWSAGNIEWSSPTASNVVIGSTLTGLDVQVASGEIVVSATTNEATDVEWYATATREVLLGSV